MLLESIIIAVIASFYIGFENDKFSIEKTLTYYGVMTIVSAVVVYGFLYLFTPSFTGILGGYFSAAFLPIILVSSILLFVGSSDIVSGGIQVLKIGLCILGIVALMFTPALYNHELYNIPKVTVYDNISQTSEFAPIDAQNMRIVDQAMAYYLGNKVMGSSDQNLGSQFEVTQDGFSIQNVNGHLYWVAPLEFQGIFKWWSRGTSPGYIMVDAEDPTAQPVLKTGYNMKYMTSAYLNTDLTRHLYMNGYDHVRLKDINFEVTDDLKPRWVISLTKPTVLNEGDVVTGVAIVDPESGNIEEYPVGSVPSWVDRVMPEETAKDYLSWYGGYVHGWWNSVTAGQDVNVISSDSMWLIHGQNGQAYWFCGMTSPSSSDQSLTSIILINSRDGTISQYRMSGWNEAAVINAVDAAVSNFKTYHASAPIPYDCSGNLAYVVPIAATSGNGEIFQEVAIVDAHTGKVVLGNTKAIALEGYKRYLNTNGYNFAITASSTRKNVTGTIARISQIVSTSDSSYRLLWLNDSNIIYEVSVSTFPTVALTYITDNVSMSYEDSNDTVINVDDFKNADVIPRVSAEQQNYTLARANNNQSNAMANNS